MYGDIKMAACSEISLKCSVCLEMYKDPRVLPCLHSYCLNCLQGLASTDVVSCPQCRAKYDVPKGGVASYPTDLSLLPELEKAKSKSGLQQESVCGLCTTGSVAVGYCNDCSEYLCKSCRDIVHKTVKAYSSHQVAPLTMSTIEQNVHDRFLKQPSFCVHHSKYELEIYCKSCVSLVCCKCMLESTHKDHQYELIENARGEIAEKVKTLMESVDSKEEAFKGCLELVEKIEKLLLTKQDEHRSRLKAFFDDIMEKVEAVFTKDKKKTWASKNHLEMMLAQVKSCHVFNSRIEQQINDGQLLSLINQLLLCLKQIDSTQTDVNDVWLVYSPSNHFEQRLSNIINATKFTEDFIKEDECDMLLKVESVKNKATNVEQALFDTFALSEQVHQIMPVVKKTVPIFYNISTDGNRNTKLSVTIGQPFAKLTQWECTVHSPNSVNMPCTVAAVSDNQLEIEFLATQGGRYSFKLIPSHITKKMEFLVQLEVTYQYDQYADELEYDEYGHYEYGQYGYGRYDLRY